MTLPAEPFTPPDTARHFRDWLAAIGVSLGTAVIVIAPFFWLGNASGHDIAFHASSWMDAAGQWREGILYPRWTEWANYGFGEPRFLFYPPLSWMLGAALSFILPWNAVPGVFIVLMQTLAGICTFTLVRRFLSIQAALIAAVSYAANPYALLIIYMRSDFAEQLACAFIPLLVLAALKLSGLAEDRTGLRVRTAQAMAQFAVAFAAVWLSNAPAGVMASYSVVLIFGWVAVEKKSLEPLWRGAGGLALGFGLIGFYLVPAAYEQAWVNIAQALSSGLLPSQNFLYRQIDDPEHNLFNVIASTVAVVLMVMTGAAALGARPRIAETERNNAARRLWRNLLLLSAVASVLMLRVSAIFWEYLPKLRFVQFPWRWMAILAVPYACFVAIAFGRKESSRWVWGIMVLAVTVGTATILVRKAWWDSQDLPVLEEVIANDQGFDGTDEYDPAGDDHTNLPQKASRVEILPAEESASEARPEAEIRIVQWTAEQRDVRLTTAKPARVVLRLLNYPAWHVTMNGKVVKPLRAEGSTQMIFFLPSGESHIQARFIRTLDRILGGVLSLASVLALTLLIWASRAVPH